MNRVAVFMLVLVVFSSCVRNKQPQSVINPPAVQQPAAAAGKMFVVNEVVQTSNYSYLRVTENMSERWVAVSKQEVKKGEKYYYDDALKMTNFHSKELDRDFPEIYFINSISKGAMNKPSMGMGGGMPAHTGKVATKKDTKISIQKTGNELTLAKLFENKEKYTTSEFEIRGVVVKVNPQVMGKNWIHIQDGTNSGEMYDLTITTQQMAKVGDQVTFKGKLTLNKNFGSGYFYEVIMENATLVNKKVS